MEVLDVEAALIAWIKKRFEVPAYAEVPRHRPESFVTVERTGGAARSAVIDNPMVAIQCWAPTRYEASELARKVHGELPGFAYEPGVVMVERNSMYNYPDSKGGGGRYQIVAEITTASN